MRARHFEILNELHSKPNHISLDRTPTCDYSASKWPCNDQIDLTKAQIPVLAINGEFDVPNARMQHKLKNFKSVVLPGKTAPDSHHGRLYPGSVYPDACGFHQCQRPEGMSGHGH